MKEKMEKVTCTTPEIHHTAVSARARASDHNNLQTPQKSENFFDLPSDC
jgi:hypothetical protein